MCELQIISFDIGVNLQKKFTVWTIVSFYQCNFIIKTLPAGKNFMPFFLKYLNIFHMCTLPPSVKMCFAYISSHVLLNLLN